MWLYMLMSTVLLNASDLAALALIHVDRTFKNSVCYRLSYAVQYTKNKVYETCVSWHQDAVAYALSCDVFVISDLRSVV